MSYTIQLRKQALKELEQLPSSSIIKITEFIDSLSANPRPKGCKKLKDEQDSLWRIRVGDYRIIYSIEETIKVIDIRKIGHRRSLYD